ncbi:hypothetical protein DPMN_103462 [Dreissena polymorpha]|uniref:Uncharacterized protein n=1 Tax=Dreissena polymorpha TaxID=45954 RepID=A0A9D4H606_DREPO|nr:hypothetical protein DPMN_103462 [Dreissena polymorpha]
MKNALPPGGHVFLINQNHFQTHIIGMNALTSFMLTKFYFSHIMKNAPPPDANTHVLTKFHEDLTINVASRVLTWKNAPPSGGHGFQPTVTVFDLVQYIIRTKVLTKFHEDRTINVGSTLLTRKMPAHWRPYIIGTNVLTKFHEIRTKLWPLEKMPRTLSVVFQPTGTIFELAQNNIGTNVLTKFHEDRTINVASRVLTKQMLTTYDAHRTTD